jgi:hypothetical protein
MNAQASHAASRETLPHARQDTGTPRRDSMPWLRQVMHVALKDARRAWGTLLGCAVLAAFATASSVTLQDVGLGSFGWSLLFILLAMAHTVSLVQADSPSRADAFWVTRPLRPSAVFGAKLVGILLLGGIGLIGQVIVLSAFAVETRAYPALLGRSLVSVSISLAAIALLAALTKDWRALLVAAIAILVVPQLLFQGGARELSLVEVAAPVMHNALVVAALLLLLAHQYQTRRVLRGAAMTAAVVIGASLLSSAASTRAPSLDRIARSAQPRSVPPVLLASLDSTSLGDGRTQLQVALAIDQPAADHRYRLVQHEVAIIDPDGSEQPLQVSNSPTWIWVDAGAEPLNPPGMPGGDRLFVERTPAQAHRLADGTARLVVRGYLEVQQATEPVIVPLQRGHTATAPGTRVRVLHARADADDVSIDLSLAHLVPQGAPHWQIRDIGIQHRPRAFSLVNTVSGERYRLEERGGSSHALGLVLPGPRMTRSDLTDVRIPVDAARGTAPRPDEAWLAASVLHVTHWHPVGIHAVEVQVR